MPSRFPFLPMLARERMERSCREAPPGWLKRGLLVDDNDMNLSFIQAIAEDFWVEMEVARSCAEARQKLAVVRQFDFALLDYRLTNGLGLEIYREITVYSAPTQVVFLTGYDSAEVQHAVHAIGPARIYSKDQAMREKFMAKLLAEMGVRARMPVGS